MGQFESLMYRSDCLFDNARAVNHQIITIELLVIL